MMEIKERLALSARPGKLTLIREGMFLKCYQQSLFLLMHSVYPDIKVTGRRIKKLGGQAVFSGGFPEAVLAKVLPEAQFTDWGAEADTDNIDEVAYQSWLTALPLAEDKGGGDVTSDRQSAPPCTERGGMSLSGQLAARAVPVVGGCRVHSGSEGPEKKQ
ncbi:hypothetical protein [Symbiopectobacterium purcellii]|uniref:Uncharacterized protein n=1 Tax=Symbiopectobacterium purcellii TaxID=2871826 RepID=A0ABX9AJR8_9ENTR|nr:hypothetical protein [Symbiopectobacterium purcellii]QZN95419.1 hypothetical protein K6K13_19905 [Symbiopectobacterium purcellii]